MQSHVSPSLLDQIFGRTCLDAMLENALYVNAIWLELAGAYRIIQLGEQNAQRVNCLTSTRNRNEMNPRIDLLHPASELGAPMD
jgi:hypothetical protein